MKLKTTLWDERFSSGDYKTEFSTAVDELGALAVPVEFRIHAVDVLTETYYEQTGQRPDPFQLERLADYILRDDLSDPHPDKVSNTEYPFLSSGQIKLRSSRETAGGDNAQHSPDTKHKLNGSRKGVARDTFFFLSSDVGSRGLRNQLEE